MLFEKIILPIALSLRYILDEQMSNIESPCIQLSKKKKDKALHQILGIFFF